MRKIAAFCALLMTTAALQSSAQDLKTEAPAPPKSPRASAKSDIAEISYGQPSKRGRVIFGELVPYGKIWRTGANMSTDITFRTDVTFAGKPVKKGTYAIFTIPEEKEWTIILNSKPGQKGSAEYEDNKESNVLEVKVPVEKLKAVQEAFQISFEGKFLVFKWDETKVAVPVMKK